MQFCILVFVLDFWIEIGITFYFNIWMKGLNLIGNMKSKIFQHAYGFLMGLWERKKAKHAYELLDGRRQWIVVSRLLKYWLVIHSCHLNQFSTWFKQIENLLLLSQWENHYRPLFADIQSSFSRFREKRRLLKIESSQLDIKWTSSIQ